MEFSHLINIENFDNKMVLDDCKQKLYTFDNSMWKAELWNDKNLENGRKLRCYRMFKTEIGLENYILLNIPWYKKKVTAMLHAGCLPLEVEKGRYHKPKPKPLAERLCSMCNSESVEDEMHFMMSCSMYDDIREPLIEYFINMNDSFYDMDLNEKNIYIMQHIEANSPCAVAVNIVLSSHLSMLPCC